MPWAYILVLMNSKEKKGLFDMLKTCSRLHGKVSRGLKILDPGQKNGTKL